MAAHACSLSNAMLALRLVAFGASLTAFYDFKLFSALHKYREKLVVPRRRYVHILGHLAEANVTFRGKGGTAEHVTDFHFKNRNGAQIVPTP